MFFLTFDVLIFDVLTLSLFVRKESKSFCKKTQFFQKKLRPLPISGILTGSLSLGIHKSEKKFSILFLSVVCYPQNSLEITLNLAINIYVFSIT
jgi:hypothetical protein